MSDQQPSPRDPRIDNFPAWYEESMSWDARLAREIPIICDVFGPPGEGGLLDAGCGTGHHVVALAKRGYRAVGADISSEMLDIARDHAREKGADVSFVHSPYATLHEKTGGGFDGIFCLANSLTCSGSAAAVADALRQFAGCLRPGGRFYIDILNFTPMLPAWKDSDDSTPVHAVHDTPTAPMTNPSPPDVNVADTAGAVAGPPDGFLLDPATTQITKVSIVEDDKCSQPTDKQEYRLYPVSNKEIHAWCEAAGLRIDEQWGSVLRDVYDTNKSVDMITIGTRV